MKKRGIKQFKNKCLQRGYEDYKNGKSFADNPFIIMPNPAKSAWWESGWLQAKNTESHK